LSFGYQLIYWDVSIPSMLSKVMDIFLSITF